MPAKKKAKATSKPAAKKAPKAKPAALPKKMSALDAAAQVLNDSGGAMTTKEMIEAMAAQKLWESPNGKTPASTLYAAILREVTTKGVASRFTKTEPGTFAATGATGATGTTDAAPDTKPTPLKKAKAAKTPKKKTPEPATTTPDGKPGPESLSALFRI